ncbi:MAG: transcription termination factor NusA [Candidatus Omnitrophica bacterium]|nr:transcription termination factor NusA [Candidatus Omnitrophota bacterium]
MNGELLTALENLEREKGISKEVLFSAIESALASAAYKILDNPNLSKESISVVMDRSTGNITVFNGDEEIRSTRFGRIAAQTAKQIMIQKIREAERSVIFDKYSEKVGEIINGAVHRFEKGNIVVELDEAEAILPKNEQLPREKFRQGQTIRAYLLEVQKKTGNLDLILSRAHAGFVKKLFEMEVPEIAQGIVTIRSIAREPGDRTKIAVWSHDDKIDAVGACVGMRGARVKEIVQELNGERIDIIRWNDDIQEFVQAAVSPVELYSMEIDRDKREIKVTVAKDQLALLIGKKGRNIRLASRLIGWEIKADSVIETVNVSIESINAIGDEDKKRLLDAGYAGTEKLIEAGVEILSKIEGFSPEKAKKIIEICEKAAGESAKEQSAEETVAGTETEEDSSGVESTQDVKPED